jgi:hypothetical protein
MDLQHVAEDRRAGVGDDDIEAAQGLDRLGDRASRRDLARNHVLLLFALPGGVGSHGATDDFERGRSS